jgi:hypothetical protein
MDSTTLLVSNEDQADTPTDEGWNAFRVWNERVRQPCGHPGAAPAQGWDPYFVWLSRVRKPDQ